MQVTKINCLSCGHFVDLGPAYDNYQGQIKCFACGAFLEVKIEDGELKSNRFVSFACRPMEEAAGERS